MQPETKREAGSASARGGQPPAWRFIVRRKPRKSLSAMAKKSQAAPHKLGANRKEPARKRPQRARNFSQSRDIREDRGERQIKTARARQTFPHLTRPK
jgi:hypothetical protein